MMLSNHDVENLFRYHGKHEHHQRADNGARQHTGREQRISLQISKDAPDRFHRAINIDASEIASRSGAEPNRRAR